MNLRPYQAQAVEDLRRAVGRHRSAVYVLPTGGGKTVVAAEIARLAAARGSRTLFLVHRRELVKQALETLSSACPGATVAVEAAGFPSIPWADLHVGMVQSLARRDPKRIQPDLVVVDEAHHTRAKTWESVLDRWPRAARIGLTATPQRLDGRGLGTHFARIVPGPTIPDLVADGHLAPVDTWTIGAIDSMSAMRRDRHGEYRRPDLEAAVTHKVIAACASAILRYARSRRTIFFGINRRHSRDVVARLRVAGLRAEHVDGTDRPGRRDQVMTGLRDGALDVVGNVDLISEGFDAPGCDCVAIGRPTRSVTRYLQMAGRAMRPGPDKRAMLLDLGGCAHELGLPDEVREWSLEDGEIAKPNPHQRPRIRECRECHIQLPLTASTCPRCAAEQTELPVEIEVELERARPSPKRRKTRLPRPELNRRLSAIRTSTSLHPFSGLMRLAEELGYQPGWAFHVYRVWREAGRIHPRWHADPPADPRRASHG